MLPIYTALQSWALSEMYTFLDWQRIARLVVKLSENEQYKALFHVADISELSYLTNISKDADTFNKYCYSDGWV